jgi:Carbohydrate-selective porin, OprB family/S-layer homology domain
MPFMHRHLPEFVKNLIFGMPILFLPLASVAGEVEGKTKMIARSQFPSETEANPMSRIPSVSQLSDVSPTAWAYQALRSLVERYGCITGYADQTFRGERTMTRYEFAAGLNTCWNSIAAVYIHDYASGGRFGFNSNGLGSAGTAEANTLAGQDKLGGEDFGFIQSVIVTNGYSAQFSWRVQQNFVLSGWFGSYYPRLIGRGDGNILSYALTFAFPDLGKEGNLLGLVVGAEPYLTRMGGDPEPFAVDLPLHIEAFYRYQITDSISITPSLIWLTAPNQDNDNPDAAILTLRTTFTF